MLCALLGLCYMCMPLSVFGSTFYSLHIKQEENQKRLELTKEHKAELKRRFGKVTKLISAGVHIKSRSCNDVPHQLSEQEMHVYEYTFHAKIPSDESQLNLKRVQDFKVCLRGGDGSCALQSHFYHWRACVSI